MKPEFACFAEASLEPDAVFTSLAASLPASPQPVPFAPAVLVMLLQGFRQWPFSALAELALVACWLFAVGWLLSQGRYPA